MRGGIVMILCDGRGRWGLQLWGRRCQALATGTGTGTGLVTILQTTSRGTVIALGAEL